MEENKSTSKKINMDLIKSALESSKPKDANQNKSKTHYYQPICNTSTTPLNKEPSLPKNYKIPMQSKHNKPEKGKETTTPLSTNNSSLKYKSNTDIFHLKHKTPTTIQDTTTKKAIHPREHNESNTLKHTLNKNMHVEKHRHKTNINDKTTHDLSHKHEKNQGKTIKIKSRQISANHSSKEGIIISPKFNVETSKPKRNKENNLPKTNKDITQCRATKEPILPKSYKDPCPPCIKTREMITQSTKSKESHNNRSLHEPTFSTKLKTKKDHLTVKSDKISKRTKHSASKHDQEKISNKQKDKLVHKQSDLCESEKDGPIPKLKKKRNTEKNDTNKECTETKKNKGNKSDVNSEKNTKDVSTSNTEDRLSKSISPIKSVVSKIKTDFQCHISDKSTYKESQNERYHKEPNYHPGHFENNSRSECDYHCHNSEKSSHRSSGVDLRTKLKRRVTKNNECKKYHNRDHLMKKNMFAKVAKGDPFVPEDNLIITFNREDEPSGEASKEESVTMKTSPVKKMVRKQPSGGNKCKKIKLEINIVFGQTDTTDDESMKSNDEAIEEPLENTDLSFLDDFNVDEIVQSLNECKDCSRNSHTEEHSTDYDTNSQEKHASNKVDSMDVDDNDLLDKIETDTEIPCMDISGVENKIEIHENIALKPAADEKHSCCEEEIQIKKEKDIEANTELSQKANPVDPNVRISCPEVLKTVLSLENATLPQNKNNIIDKSQWNTTEINIANNNSIKNINCTLLAPKKKISEEADNTVEDVKLEIASSEITEAKLMAEHTCSSNDNHRTGTLQKVSHKESINNHNLEIIKEECAENETLPAQESNIIETAVASTQNVIETPTRIKEESEIILIDDSESENETETEKHRVKSESKSDIQPREEIPLSGSDEVVIIESPSAAKSEPIIIPDTDYNIEESSDKVSQLTLTNKNATSESEIHNLVCEIKTDTEVKPNNPVLQDASGEVKTDAAETEVESCKAQRQHSENKNNIFSDVKTPIDITSDMEVKTDKATTDTSVKTKSENGKVQEKQEKEKLDVEVVMESHSKMSPKPSKEKPSETDIVVDKQSSLIQAVVDAKTQNVNTRLETKPSKQNSPQTNTKTKEENEVKVISIANSRFLQQLESKLCSMGTKCTITEMKRQGKFSSMYICQDSSKREYALKLLRKQCDGYNLGLQTEKMMMKLQKGVPENNLNCVRLIYGFIHSGIWCFLMEYYPRNLQEALSENQRSFHIDVVQVLSRQLVSAVTILRNNNIIHSDIKPSHILINAAQTRLKLCGFDQACYLERSNLLPNTGTVNYRAPELILGYPAGYGIDVWSTALVMYEMATNQTLFPGYYNNNILYQQLSMLGNIPLDMLNASTFRNAHFRDTLFMRKMEHGEKYMIDNFVPNGKLSSVVFNTYGREWAPGRSQMSKRSDRANLNTFVGLLRSMLVMHPRYRIAIEFVFANPFIYECFDTDY